MKIPLSWLREFVPVEASPDALAEKLSVSGFAVEEMIVLGRDISGVVVGEVRAMREHPNADSLMLVRAFDGEAERDIVCGARNYEVGDRVPLARPGARLPGGVEIGERKVRGEVSHGMLCSARELQIADDHSGILILDRDAPLGADVVHALELDDVVLHLDITTNRGDALSVVGIAREVAALYGLPLTVPVPAPREDGEPIEALASVRIEDARGCPRYLARALTGTTVGPSPWWLRRRLWAAGMRPISNVVDVTNYVLLERGQPLHAFDLDELSGAQIVVRKPRKSETITTLDGTVRALQRDDVVICDADKPVAVAGVMGGSDSEVSDKTSRILLESAYFDPQRIRPTARRLGLRTEASVRFERGADPEGVPAAAARAAELLAELTGGVVARGAIDEYPRPWRPRTVRMRVARANALIGTTTDAAEMTTHLRALGCAVEASRTALRVTPPSWRPDLVIEEDLVEEIARLHGYDRIPEALPSGARTGGLSSAQRLRALARETMLGAGLDEAQTQSLLSPSFAERAQLPEDHATRTAPRIGNPLSEDESLLRPALLPGLVLAAARNASRRVLPVRLFEIGNVFRRDGVEVVETLNLTWVLYGPARDSLDVPERELDVFDAQAVMRGLFDALGIDDYAFEAYEDEAGFHPGRTALVRARGDVVGIVGDLHPRTAESLELPGRVATGGVNLAAVIERAGNSVVRVPPRLPAVARDVAVVVPAGVPAADVARAIRDAGGMLLETLDLFDRYTGDQAGEGRVSLAFALTLRDPERTLTDADADKVLAAIRTAVTDKGWTVRD